MLLGPRTCHLLLVGKGERLPRDRDPVVLDLTVMQSADEQLVEVYGQKLAMMVTPVAIMLYQEFRVKQVLLHHLPVTQAES